MLTNNLNELSEVKEVLTIDEMLGHLEQESPSHHKEVYGWGFFNLNKMVELAEKHLGFVRIIDKNNNYYFEKRK